MQVHASCASLTGAGVLLVGPSGSGKSDLLLRLLDRGFTLVADDRVVVEGNVASAPLELAGLIEVRGLGIFRLPYEARTRLALVVDLATRPERLPRPIRHGETGLPMVGLDARMASAPERITLALRTVLGRVKMEEGALMAERTP